MQRGSGSFSDKFQLLQVYEPLLGNTVHLCKLSVCFCIQLRGLPSMSHRVIPVNFFAKLLQFLFIDLLLILPIAIFSKFQMSLNVREILLTVL